MSLRKHPTRTPALLAANRANAKKSTGPRSPRGKARVALNALKHGRYAVALERQLVRMGDRDGEAQYRWFRSEITQAFGVGGSGLSGRPGPVGPADLRQAEQLAARAWCVAHQAARNAVSGTKPECHVRSRRKESQLRVLLRIRIDDRVRRIGLAFWVQRHMYWTFERRVGALRALLGAGPRPAVPLDRELVPTSGSGSSGRLERRWRRRRFRLRRPGLWERLELEERFRREGNRAGRSQDRIV